MKNLTKVLSIIMVLAMVLSFVSCGSSEAPAPVEAPAVSSETSAPEVPAPTESGAKDTVVAFMDAMVKLDSAAMAENMVGGVMPEGMEDLDMVNIVTPIAQESGMPLDAFMDIMYKIMAEALKYEVNSVEEDGDTAVAKITLLSKDTSALENLDFDAIMADADMEAKLMELLESGELSENSSEEEIMEAVMDMIMPVMEDAMLGAMEDMEYAEEEMELSLVKENGAWKIQDDENFAGADFGNILGDLSL